MKTIEEMLFCTVNAIKFALPTTAVVAGIPLGNVIAKEVIKYNLPEKIEFCSNRR